MVVRRVWVQGYRSLRDVSLPLGDLTVVRGANASGKTNLYRALWMLARGANGELARSLLAEGGMPSAMWAGDPAAGRSRRPVRMVFGIQVDELSYELALGLPSIEPTSPFALDAELKEERVWLGTAASRHAVLMDRAGASATARDVDGRTVTFAVTLDRFEPALSQLGEPARFPELFDLRERLSRWRFYHSFPSDVTARSRAPQPGVRTPVLADDGHDLAAALATIEEMGHGPALHDAVAAAFPGYQLQVSAEGGHFAIGMAVPGVRRPMTGFELSDGTLRFLCLAAALLSPRPPELLVLNEPETSLHPDVLPALGTLISTAAEQTQIVVTTHSGDLADQLARNDKGRVHHLERATDGSTVLRSIDTHDRAAALPSKPKRRLTRPSHTPE
jgi:predicted ATPase